jgi:type II secretory pathway pseudopilin PulG
MSLKHRFALTLIELLVTLAVVSALALLILPSVKSLLLDRKSSQSAIVVKNYLEAARSRAIASGKPVAVVLERLSSQASDSDEDGQIVGAEIGVSATAVEVTAALDNFQTASADPFINYLTYNACIRLSMAETPLPETSESMGMGPLIVTQFSQNLGTSEGPIVSEGISGDGYIVAGIFLEQYDGSGNVQSTTYASRVLSSLRPSLGTARSYPRKPVDVSFGLSPSKYAVFQTELTTLKGLSYLRLYFVSSSDATNPTEIANNINNPIGEYPITIYEPPRPIATQTVTLPRGMCIDLSLSGFSEVRHMVTDAATPVLRQTRDYRRRLSSTWVSPISAATGRTLAPTPQANELRPVYIVFNPNGSFSRIYGNYEANGGRPSFASKAVDAAEDLFLHIGKIDQIGIASVAPYSANLDDPASYIVRLSPRSGSVAVAPTGAIRLPEDAALSLVPALSTADDLGEFIALARKRAFTQNVTGQ